MAQVTWTTTAQQNAQAIRRYIAQEAPNAAAVMVRRFRSEAAQLARFPEMGRMVPEYADPRVRELIISPYRLLYRFDADVDLVRVIGVVHGSRMLPPLHNL